MGDNILLTDLEQTFEECLKIATAKNNDYGGTNGDPFHNFENTNLVGVSPPKGILVRMVDKMSRIATLLDKDPKVSDESIEDTLNDLINYSAILKSYLKQRGSGIDHVNN